MKSFGYLTCALCALVAAPLMLYLGTLNNNPLGGLAACFLMIAIGWVLSRIGERKQIEESIGRRLFKGLAL